MTTPSAREPEALRVHVEGRQFALYEWRRHLRGSKPSLIFTHAAGFHARCWDTIIDQFPQHHVLAMDLRGHGASSGGDFNDWFDLASDLQQVLDSQGVDKALGVGHSLGACCTLVCAAKQPTLFQRLLLIDPVILAPDEYISLTAAHEAAGRPTHFAAKRRSTFDSREQFAERIGSKDPYNRFHPEILQQYCRYGVHSSASGRGVELACQPAFEAKIYQTGIEFSPVLELLNRVQVPTRIVRVRRAAEGANAQNFNDSPTWTGLAAALPMADERVMPDYTHFLPLQAPDVAVELIRDYLLNHE